MCNRINLVEVTLAILTLMICMIFNSAVHADGRPGPAQEMQMTTGKMNYRAIAHGGIVREYFVYLPHAYKRGQDMPVVIALHGYTGTATGFELETSSGFNRYAESKGFIAVYPQASYFISETSEGKPWFISSWNDLGGNHTNSPLGPMCTDASDQYPCPPECGECKRCHWTSCNDDIGFIKKLLEDLSVNYHTDKQRFYLTGASNGAMMAHRLACEYSDKFAAVVLVIGRLERGYSCTPAKTLPLLQINAALDTTVPHDDRPSSDGYYYTSTKTVSKTWADAAGCSIDPIVWSNPIVEAQGLQCMNYKLCNEDGIDVVNCLWPEGKHVWPGNIGGGGWCVGEEQADSIPHYPLCEQAPKDVKVWGTDLMWDFFSQHSQDRHESTTVSFNE